MTILQADGMTEVTLHGPNQQSTLQTTAQRGPAHTAKLRNRRKKLNTRKRVKNENMGKRRAPRASLRSHTCQRVKGQCLQEEDLSSEDLTLHLIPPLVSNAQPLAGDSGPRCPPETRGPTLDPIHPVSPDLEDGPGPGPGPGPGLTQDPGACPGLEVDPCLDPDLIPFPSPGLHPGPEQDPGIDPGLCHGPKREIYPGPREREKQASQSQMPLSMCQKRLPRAKSHLSPDSPVSQPPKVSL